MEPNNNNRNTVSSSSSEEEKAICDKALDLLSLGNDDAKLIMQEACLRHGSSALFHRVHSTILSSLADSSDDLATKKLNYQQAIAYALQASTLSPSNLDFSLSYARLLVLHNSAFQDAVQECDRALEVVNPIDFVSELHQEDPHEWLRVERHQEELRFLLSILKSSLLPDEFKKKLTGNPDAVRFRACLHSLTTEDRRGLLLQVGVKEFADWAAFSETSRSIVKEALSFVQSSRSWKFLICPRCPDQKFRDTESQLQHVQKEHLHEALSSEQKKMLPTENGQDWINKLLDGASWEPVPENINPQLNESDDFAERKKLLQLIQALFEMLLKYDYLAASHVKAVSRMCAADGVVHDKSPLTLHLRELDTLQLQEVLDFLLSISRSCRLGKFADDDAFLDSTPPETTSNARMVIFFDQSSSTVELDMGQLSQDSAGDGIRSSTPDAEAALMYWVYEPDGDPEESTESWAKQRDVLNEEADQIIQMIENKLEELRSLCIERSEALEYLVIVRHIKKKCSRSTAQKSSEAILREWHEGLAKCGAKEDDDIAMKSLTDVFKEARCLQLTTARSLSNACIEAARSKLEKSFDAKAATIDAKIVKNLARDKQLKIKLSLKSALDYRSVLEPLLKSYLQMEIKRKVEELSRKELMQELTL